MLICAFDTSGRDGSLALARGDASSFELLHLSPIAGGTYSAELIPQLSSALDKTHLSKNEIQLLVAASGPGSFTGLRVGLSTVKALSETLGAPIVAISVMEAIAYSIKKEGTILAALDAQRSEVFVGEYEVKTVGATHSISNLHEALATVSDFTTWLSARTAVSVTYTPDAALLKKVQESGSPAEFIARPGADVYARLGLQKFLAGETSPADSLDANYIRRSDAEIFSAPKLGIK